jgi:hypothetical protein
MTALPCVHARMRSRLGTSWTKAFVRGSIAGRWPLVAGRWPLVAGRWCWWLVAGAGAGAGALGLASHGAKSDQHKFDKPYRHERGLGFRVEYLGFKA